MSDDQSDDKALLLQDWKPMSACLDWRIGRVAWSVLGGQLFADGEVPNLAHDSGTHSARCAQLLLGWCNASKKAGTLPDTIQIVEYAMGTGLFMRYLLDSFRKLCATSDDDYYDRLHVYATDVSAPMLHAAAKRGLFTDHAQHVTLAFADILRPGTVRPLDSEEPIEISGSVHVVFSNYAIDLLPIDIFRRLTDDNGTHNWETVLVRSWLRDADRLRAYTDATTEEIAELAKRNDAASIAALGPIYSLVQTELRTFPVDITTHPDHSLLESYADHLESELGTGHALLEEGTVVYHSGGAIEAVERVGETLADGGLALFRDVGLHTAELAAVARTYQQFGPTVAAAINVIELDHHFATNSRSGLKCLAPDGDGVRDQVVRVFVRGETAVDDVFAAAFNATAAADMAELLDKARRCEDPREALELYRSALSTEPNNWGVMVEAAARVLTGGLDPSLAVVIAGRGLTINTEHSADLWTVYGDALWAGKDRVGARKAYNLALEVHPRHARAHYGAGYIDAEDGRFESAFVHVGAALAHDRDGLIRGDVLQLLDICLRAQRGSREHFWRRISEKANR